LITGKQLVVVVIVVCVFSVSAVYVWQGGQVTQTGGNAQTTENFEVTYELHRWNGDFYTITIKDNGAIIENYTQEEENKITKIGALAENELQEFKNLVIGANVFVFENNYTSENAQPGYYYYEIETTTIRFAIAGKTKIISISFGANLPENMMPGSGSSANLVINLPENLPENLATIIQKFGAFGTLWSYPFD